MEETMKRSAMMAVGCLAIPLAAACTVSPDSAVGAGVDEEHVHALYVPPDLSDMPANPLAAQDCDNLLALANSDYQGALGAAAGDCPAPGLLDQYYADFVQVQHLANQVCMLGYPNSPSAWQPALKASADGVKGAIESCYTLANLDLRCPLVLDWAEDYTGGCGKRIGTRHMWRMCTNGEDFKDCQQHLEGFAFHKEEWICHDDIQYSYTTCAIDVGTSPPPEPPPSATIPAPPSAPANCTFYANCGGAVTAMCPYPLPATMAELVLYRDDTGSNPVAVAYTGNIPQSVEAAPALYISDPGVPTSVSVGNYTLCAFDEYGQYGCTYETPVTIDFSSCGGGTVGGSSGGSVGGFGGTPVKTVVYVR
jgi:hypothetical protein